MGRKILAPVGCTWPNGSGACMQAYAFSFEEHQEQILKVCGRASKWPPKTSESHVPISAHCACMSEFVCSPTFLGGIVDQSSPILKVWWSSDCNWLDYEDFKKGYFCDRQTDRHALKWKKKFTAILELFRTENENGFYLKKSLVSSIPTWSLDPFWMALTIP